MADKVFCSECKYLAYREKLTDCWCRSPKNENLSDNWYAPNHVKIMDKGPQVVNINNDCPWFEALEVRYA